MQVQKINHRFSPPTVRPVCNTTVCSMIASPNFQVLALKLERSRYVRLYSLVGLQDTLKIDDDPIFTVYPTDDHDILDGCFSPDSQWFYAGTSTRCYVIDIRDPLNIKLHGQFDYPHIYSRDFGMTTCYDRDTKDIYLWMCVSHSRIAARRHPDYSVTVAGFDVLVPIRSFVASENGKLLAVIDYGMAQSSRIHIGALSTNPTTKAIELTVQSINGEPIIRDPIRPRFIYNDTMLACICDCNRVTIIDLVKSTNEAISFQFCDRPSIIPSLGYHPQFQTLIVQYGQVGSAWPVVMAIDPILGLHQRCVLPLKKSAAATTTAPAANAVESMIFSGLCPTGCFVYAQESQGHSLINLWKIQIRNCPFWNWKNHKLTTRKFRLKVFNLLLASSNSTRRLIPYDDLNCIIQHLWLAQDPKRTFYEEEVIIG